MDDAPQLYVEYRNGFPHRYAFGEPWIAYAMYIGDYGFATEAEAREDYNRRITENNG